MLEASAFDSDSEVGSEEPEQLKTNRNAKQRPERIPQSYQSDAAAQVVLRLSGRCTTF